MKKAIIIVSAIILAAVIVLMIQHITFKHTPESVLKVHFKMSLKGFDYTVDTFQEQWCPNGDGEAFVIYKFNELTQDNIDYLKGFGLKPLPISGEGVEQRVSNKIHKEYYSIDTGYYFYGPLSSHDPGDYKILILDIEKKIMIFYYQYI